MTQSVTAHRGHLRIRTGFQVILYEIPKGNLAMYYPEANPLIAMTDFDKKSGMPAFKTVSVRLRKCA